MPAVVENPHRETAPAARHSLADAAKSVNPERLVVDIGSPQQGPFPLLPASLAHVPVAFDHAPGDGHQERESKVGGRFFQHAGGVRDRDAPARARGHVDVVITDAHVGDHPQAGRLKQGFFVKTRATHHDALLVATRFG